MDWRLSFSRTEKGRLELLGTERALKPKQRQVLFMVGDNVTLGTLAEQLPNCTELETIVQHLWDEGYIGLVNSGSVTSGQDRVREALAVIGSSRLDAARQHAMAYLAPIIGEHSPAFQRLRSAADAETFTSAVAESRKLVAAVASSSKAMAFEAGVMAILNLPAPQGPHHNGIDTARQHALQIIASHIGEASPAYIKIREAGTREQFLEAVRSGRRILAAAASASKAAAFEREVMDLLGG